MEVFYQRWILDLQNLLGEFVTAATEHYSDDTHRLCALIHITVAHFKRYYLQRSHLAESGDVFQILNPTWISTLGRTFLWIGGWKPSLVFRILKRACSGRALPLSPAQATSVEELEKEVLEKERRLTDVMTRIQDAVVLLRFLGLIGGPTTTRNGHVHVEEDGVLEAVAASMRTLLRCADGLRAEIVTTLLEILSPLQAVVFLSSAIELYLLMWRFGTRQPDADNPGITANNTRTI